MSTTGVAHTVPWALTGAFGCWLSTAATRSWAHPDQHSLYPGSAGPVYVAADAAVVPVTDIAHIARDIDEIRHHSAMTGDPGLPPGCRLLPDAVQAGSCLLVRSKTRWHLWVPQLDPAHHRPATVWQTEALDDAPITPRGAERSAFQQSLLAALSAVETLGVRAWLTDADSRTSGAQRGQHRSQLAADRGEGARHNETGLPPLPHEVDSGIREELLRVNRIRIGLQMAVTALRAGQTSSSRSRAAAAVHHIEQLSDLQRSARAYTDALWDRAFALCRPSS